MTRETKALLVIDALCADECLRVNDVRNHPKSCFYCQIYTIAHSASRSCKHETWWAQTEKLYKELAR